MACLVDRATLEASGFAFSRGIVAQSTIRDITSALDRRSADSTSPNARRLLESYPAVAQLADSTPITELVAEVLGEGAFAVRGILFDKVPASNWRVGWHQDLMVPVAYRVDTPGYTAWSTKQGVVHVRPPAEVLAGMLTLRIHLDDCTAENGPLEVLPGTHRLGIVPECDVRRVAVSRQPVTCTATAGDVLCMRPLLFHASRPAKHASHRRVIHLEYAVKPLPDGLVWH